MRVCVVGTGYVGLVTGTCLADLGHHVCCYDVDAAKLAKLRAGHIPLYEPGLEDVLARATRSEHLKFSTDLREALHDCEVCFIAVGTPPGEDGSADLTHVLAVCKDIAATMTARLTVVVKSTVPVGTCDLVRETLRSYLKARGAVIPFSVCSNPEFLKEGSAVDDFMHPDRIVVGCDDAEGEAVMRELYQPFVRMGRRLFVLDIRSSEMTKYAANVILAARISMINEIAGICEWVGADVMAVRQAAGADRRIGTAFLYPGVGYGGSCFPKDVPALIRLAEDHGVEARMLRATQETNLAQREVIADAVLRRFGPDLSERRVGVWGLAFKSMTDDIRESAAIVVIERLLHAGATIVAHDPEAAENTRRYFADNNKISFVTAHEDAVKNGDALLVMTEWPCYRSPDLAELVASMRTPVVFDGRNIYEPDAMIDAGFEYRCIGRGIYGCNAPMKASWAA